MFDLSLGSVEKSSFSNSLSLPQHTRTHLNLTTLVLANSSSASLYSWLSTDLSLSLKMALKVYEFGILFENISDHIVATWTPVACSHCL